MEVSRQVDLSAYETDVEDYLSSEGEDDGGEDEELYEQMETLALRDMYSAHSPHDDDELYSSDSSVQMSPRKKRKLN